MFQKFQEDKIVENLSKFYRIDKNMKIVSDETIKYEKESNPEKKEEIKKKIDEANVRVHKAEIALEISKPFAAEYEEKGAEWVATQIETNADIKNIIRSRLGDKLNSFFKTEQLKVLANKDTTKTRSYILAKQAVDSLKPLTKYYDEGGFELMIAKMIEKQHIGSTDAPSFKEKMRMDVHKDLAIEVERANNKMLRWFMIGGLFIFILTFIYNEQIKEPNASRQSNVFKRLQLLSSAGFSIGHGGNDAQKVMGIIAAALVANGDILDIKDMPNWVPVACYAAIGLGTLSGGWKIVKTMGTKITKVTPLEGVCAETAGATTLFLTEQMGIPVSTTHTITGSIIGVGATKRLSAVRWGVTVNLMWAWILTIPVSAALAALCFWIVSFFI
jgi:phosphate/sulfate permease